MNFDFSKLQTELLMSIQLYFPRIAAAIIVLIFGWLVSLLLKFITFRILKSVSKMGFMELHLKDYRNHDATLKSASTIVFWLSFLLAIASAGRFLGLPVISGSLSQLASYLPNLLAAVLVIVAGIVIGGVGRAAVSRAAKSAQLPHAALMGEGSRVSILLLAVMIALSQVGIDSTVLILAFGLVLGGSVGGLALAFGIGARTSVSNLLAIKNVGHYLKIGSKIKVGDIEGCIIQITSGAVIIQTTQGQAHVPAKLLEEAVTIMLAEKDL